MECWVICLFGHLCSIYILRQVLVHFHRMKWENGGRPYVLKCSFIYDGIILSVVLWQHGMDRVLHHCPSVRESTDYVLGFPHNEPAIRRFDGFFLQILAITSCWRKGLWYKFLVFSLMGACCSTNNRGASNLRRREDYGTLPLCWVLTSKDRYIL